MCLPNVPSDRSNHRLGLDRGRRVGALLRATTTVVPTCHIARVRSGWPTGGQSLANSAGRPSGRAGNSRRRLTLTLAAVPGQGLFCACLSEQEKTNDRLDCRRGHPRQQARPSRSPNWSATRHRRCCFTTPAASITGVRWPGKRRGLTFDPELLYAGAMFHDLGLDAAGGYTPARAVRGGRGQRGARFPAQQGISRRDIDTVWTAIALHTTPGIPQHMSPVVALVTAGVEMDVLGSSYSEYADIRA